MLGRLCSHPSCSGPRGAGRPAAPRWGRGVGQTPLSWMGREWLPRSACTQGSRRSRTLSESDSTHCLGLTSHGHGASGGGEFPRGISFAQRPAHFQTAPAGCVFVQ